MAKIDHESIISFCLFGDNPLYLEGAMQNISLAHEIYPGWRTVFYVSDKIPADFLEELKAAASEVHCVQDVFTSEREQLICGMYWRLYALELTNMTRIIFRDCDSRLSRREAVAVEEWSRSGKSFHFMYDHPYHGVPILGGMWGYAGAPILNIRSAIENFHLSTSPDTPYYDRCDQSFLRDFFWTRLKNTSDYLAHGELSFCEYHRSEGITVHPFPVIPEGAGAWSSNRFVGQTIPVPGARPKASKT
jgi:hypothetical protein